MCSRLFRRPISLIATVQSLKRSVREFKVYTLADQAYKTPWERPKPSVEGAVVTHLDASMDEEGGTGGAVSWVTRDSQGDVLDQGSKWIPNTDVDVTRPSDLEFLSLVVFTSAKPKFGSVHTICNDNDGNILNLARAAKGVDPKNEMMKGFAKTVVRQLRVNFPPSTKVIWVPRKLNMPADSLAKYEKSFHVEKVAAISGTWKD